MLCLARGAGQTVGVERDHQFFVGVHDHRARAAGGGDDSGFAAVGFVIDRSVNDEAEETQMPQYFFTDVAEFSPMPPVNTSASMRCNGTMYSAMYLARR